MKNILLIMKKLMKHLTSIKIPGCINIQINKLKYNNKIHKNCL